MSFPEDSRRSVTTACLPHPMSIPSSKPLGASSNPSPPPTSRATTLLPVCVGRTSTSPLPASTPESVPPARNADSNDARFHQPRDRDQKRALNPHRKTCPCPDPLRPPCPIQPDLRPRSYAPPPSSTSPRSSSNSAPRPLPGAVVSFSPIPTTASCLSRPTPISRNPHTAHNPDHRPPKPLRSTKDWRNARSKTRSTPPDPSGFGDLIDTRARPPDVPGPSGFARTG